MSMIETYKSRLIAIQELSILDTIDLVERASQCDLDTQDGRGDSKWLYSTANQSLSIVAKLESLLQKQQAESNTENEMQKRQEKEAKQLLDKVTAEYANYKNKDKKIKDYKHD